MKNHWLKQHEKKNRRFWTAEFSFNGAFQLRQRRADILDPLNPFDYMGSTAGSTCVNFKGGMTVPDKELVDFLVETRKGMRGWLARMRYFMGLNDELEFYELTDLHFKNIGMGKSIDDINVTFDYNKVKHVFCA
jgi:hypothetical protein